MTAAIEDIAARLAALEDKDAIRQLKARYLRACDTKQPDEVRDCFAPGPVNIAYQNFPVFTDRGAFVDIYTSMACQPGVYDIHHGANAEITLTGPDSATAKWALSFRTILLGPRQIVHLGVEYDDVYRKQDGRWWIVETVSRIVSMLTEQVDAEGKSTFVVLGEPAAAPQ